MLLQLCLGKQPYDVYLYVLLAARLASAILAVSARLAESSLLDCGCNEQAMGSLMMHFQTHRIKRMADLHMPIAQAWVTTPGSLSLLLATSLHE